MVEIYAFTSSTQVHLGVVRRAHCCPGGGVIQVSTGQDLGDSRRRGSLGDPMDPSAGFLRPVTPAQV
jgi:hypothetical protein